MPKALHKSRNYVREIYRKAYLGDVFKLCFIFTPKIGEDEPISTHIFQMGWFNHQLDIIWHQGGCPRENRNKRRNSAEDVENTSFGVGC